jgi:hypothetical protein
MTASRRKKNQFIIEPDCNFERDLLRLRQNARRESNYKPDSVAEVTAKKRKFSKSKSPEPIFVDETQDLQPLTPMDVAINY